MNRKKIIIIGGGFAGIQLVRKLDEKLFEILLIDKINHHQFQPLFYQVATSQIEPSSISFPLRDIFKNKRNIQIRLAQVVSLDTATNKVITTIGDFSFDYLVIAIGCKTNYFGNNQIQKFSFSLKSTYDAILIRNHIIQTFENIISANDSEKEALLNLVIVGAGPTGVELAGAFAEIKQHILSKDYPGLDFSKFKIILIEGSKHTLNNMSANAKVASELYLQKMEVTIIMETFVKNYNGVSLELSNGHFIKTKTVIWTAGVIGNKLGGLPEQCFTISQRIRVNRISQVLGFDNLFAIGDIASMETPLYPKGHPQVANVAIHQAKNLGKNLNNLLNGKPSKDYEYNDLGSMATIGRNKAVVDLPFYKFNGFIAWIIWMFLHLMLILSVRNKIIIFINWAWAYFTQNTSLRLILTPENKTTNDSIQ